MHDDDDVQRFNVHLKVDRSQLSLAYSAKIKTDMPENKKKQLESVESVRWRTMEERICGRDEFLAWSGREKE